MASPTQSALNEIRAAMAATNQIFIDEVVGKRNTAALARIYTRDARILPPGAQMIEGQPAIIAFWTELIQATNAQAVTLESIDVMPDGASVIEIGKAKLTVPAEGGTVEMEAKYVVCWRQEDGNWKWHIDIWNFNS